MDDTREESSDCSVLSVEEQDISHVLNNACLLDDSQLPLDLTHIPETPSPLTVRRKRRYCVSENQSELSRNSQHTRRSEMRDVNVAQTHQTPNPSRTPKRRKLKEAKNLVGGAENRGFVPASSLLYPRIASLESPQPSTSASSSSLGAENQNEISRYQTGPHTRRSKIRDINAASLLQSNFICLESPQPSTSTVSSPSTSTASSSVGAPDLATSGAAAGQICSSAKSLRGQCSKRQNREHGEQTLTMTYAFISPKSNTSASTSQRLEAQEEDSPSQNSERGNELVEIVILEEEEEEDDYEARAAEATVRMAEDEAFARRLQEQFDIEERLQREQSRARATTSTRHPFDPHLNLDWIPSWSSLMVTSLPPGCVNNTNRRGGTRQSGRGRRRQGPSMSLEMFDDSQGNNYEALLEFEETQGAVMAKPPPTQEEIENFPRIFYDPKNNTENSECRICFSEYEEGEELRLLPCFHSYHVKCIDYWLKQNTTCPVCRADVMELCNGALSESLST